MGACKLWPMDHSWPTTCFCKNKTKNSWNSLMDTLGLCSVYDCFHTTRAELSSYRDCMTYKTILSVHLQNKFVNL